MGGFERNATNSYTKGFNINLRSLIIFWGSGAFPFYLKIQNPPFTLTSMQIQTEMIKMIATKPPTWKTPPGVCNGHAE